MASRIPLLLDTDIGSDIDDALALAYLLGEPRCELLGITAVSGRPNERAMLAAWQCAQAGRSDVPVFAGLEKPLLGAQRQPSVPQFAAVPKEMPFNSKGSEPWTALEFMRRTIRSRPGEVVLLAVGPLTNVATLFLADPEIPRLLKQIVLMSGTFGLTEEGKHADAEWNVLCDPAAAAIVFREAPPGSLTAVALDVTFRCRMSRDEVANRLAAGPGAAQAANQMLEHWEGDPVIFHDPLAAAVIFKPDLCRFAKGVVEIELCVGHAVGVSRWSSGRSGPHRACSNVDVKAFFDEYFRVACGTPTDM